MTKALDWLARCIVIVLLLGCLRVVWFLFVGVARFCYAHWDVIGPVLEMVFTTLAVLIVVGWAIERCKERHLLIRRRE